MIIAHLDGRDQPPTHVPADGEALYPELFHWATRIGIGVEVVHVGIEEGRPEGYYLEPGDRAFVPIVAGSRGDVVSIESRRSSTRK